MVQEPIPLVVLRSIFITGSSVVQRFWSMY